MSSTIGRRSKFHRALIPGALVLCFCGSPRVRGSATDKPENAQTRTPTRSATVLDVIRMTKVGDRISQVTGRIAEFSPDGHRFVVVLRRGNIEENTNEYSLILWNTDRLQSPSSRVLVTMSSSSNRPGIDRVSWVDNDTVAFLGEHPGELHQLYTIGVTTRELKRLTEHPTSLIYYSMTPDTRRIAYVAEAALEPLFNGDTRRRGLPVADPRRLAAGVGNLIERKVGGILAYPELYARSVGGTSKRIVTEGAVQMCCETYIALSPDGMYAVMALRAQRVPASWQEYSTSWIRRLAKRTVPVGGYSALMTYMLINTRTGQNTVLLNVPLNSNGWQVAWSPDSRSVAIGGAYLPLDSTTGPEREFRRSRSVALEIQVPSGQQSIISSDESSDELRLVRWSQTPRCVLFRKGSMIDMAMGKLRSGSEEVCFDKKGGTWERLAIEARDQRPDIALEEDSNTPPKLYAIQAGRADKLLLFDLNPQFRELRFGRVEEISWKDDHGQDVKAGLYYPVDYIPGRKYPLVIQTHGWSLTKFWIDGPFSSAFAAQPLAGRGIMVAQLPSAEDKMGTLDEAPLENSRFKGVIDYLDGKGLIDRDRVGVIGFSRTCFHIKYALTHSGFEFAAASVTEGFDGGYISYVFSAPFAPYFTQDIESVNGGAPYGRTLASWLERAPDFNIEKVKAPILITSLRPIGAVIDWQWFALLKLLGRPVDMVVLEDGSHILERPRDIMISLEGNVDWFSFWLKDEEDPDPAKAEQYFRWRELKKLQEENTKKLVAEPKSN